MLQMVIWVKEDIPWEAIRRTKFPFFSHHTIGGGFYVEWEPS